MKQKGEGDLSFADSSKDGSKSASAIKIDCSSVREMEERCLHSIRPFVERLHDWREKSSKSTTVLG